MIFKLKEIKILLPQIIAAMVAGLSLVLVNTITAYSSILLPQINDGVGGIKLNESLSVWIVSCIIIIQAICCWFIGALVDKFGRLNVIKLSAIPNLIGWTIIALSTDGVMLLIGRSITGISLSMLSGTPIVYIAEISSPNLRCALLGTTSVWVSIGTLLTYVKGSFISWWLFAWLVNVYTITIALLVSFIPESPFWLVSKNRLVEAKNAIRWLNQYQHENLELLVDTELLKLQQGLEQTDDHCKNAGKLQMLRLPITYKPLIILTILFAIQQFCGVHILTMNAVDFFKNIGTNFDPYLASTYMAIMRLIMSIALIWILQKFKRRSILIVNALGICVTMTISGLYTKWMSDGVTDSTWIPLCMLILCFMFMTSIFNIPFMLTGEIFPLQIRGIASNITLSIASIIIFSALQSYSIIQNFLGGPHGLQYFFAVVAAIGVIFIYFFVPETHKKTLTEIEAFFWTRTVYISNSCCTRN